MLHLTGLRRIRKITCTALPREGPGSQALMKMNALNFARASGLEYFHTPFQHIQNPQSPMPEWVATWEQLFNLGQGEAECPPDAKEIVDYCFNHPGLELIFGWRDRRNQLFESFLKLVPEFKRRFHRNEFQARRAEIRVAINVRRGEVSATSNRARFTPDEKVLCTMRAIKSVLDRLGEQYRLDVYSNGNAAEFKDFTAIGAQVFTNPEYDAAQTMRQLIDADVLVMAKGAFSAYAGLLCSGIRIYEPRAPGYSLPGLFFDAPPGPDWLPCLAGGAIDEAALAQRLIVSRLPGRVQAPNIL